MMKRSLAMRALLLGSAPALAAPDSCERVKNDIQQKIVNNGVPAAGFTLAIVPNDQPDQPGAQVSATVLTTPLKLPIPAPPTQTATPVNLLFSFEGYYP
jgi:hypothetical protein